MKTTRSVSIINMVFPPTPASEFLERRRSELADCDPHKSDHDCIVEAMIDLVASNIPLDSPTRSWVAEEMARLYDVRDHNKDAARNRRLLRESENLVFEQVKHSARKRGATPGEAEKIAQGAVGKAITADAHRKRSKRRRTKDS
jgi:hypothetical protein